jgi:two-component system, chemotaxis family, CheB/CheR fusion protein
MALSQIEHELDSLLEHLERNRAFNFGGYKRSTLARRIEKRVRASGANGFAEYRRFLDAHPEEYDALCNTILINVTSFFRDDGAWTHLASVVLPDLIARKDSNEVVRVWSAGCASGEEPFTLAMVFAELMGIDGFKSRVKIHATDVDADALAKAHRASYGEREVAHVPLPLLKKYFERDAGSWVFREDLRRLIDIGHSDIFNDPPIANVDVLACRNTLMYMTAETQETILGRFHSALNEAGILLLGRAESPMQRARAFEPVDLRRRIFRKARNFIPPAAADSTAEAHTKGRDESPIVSAEMRRIRRQRMIAQSAALVASAKRAIEP